MKRKHDIDTNTNQDGCKAVIPEDYSRQKAAKIQEHETDSTLITKQKVKPILIGGVSVMDGAVILSILKSALLQEPALSFIMSFGVALVVNILPVFIAKFVHQAIYQSKRYAKVMAIVFIAAFLIVYGSTVMLRFAYKDTYKEENQTIQLENDISSVNGATTSSNSNDNSSSLDVKSTALVLFLSLIPLVTASLAFGISYVTDDEIRKRLEFLECRDIELAEAISDIEAALSAMNSDLERDLALDEAAMNAAKNEIYARRDILKAIARRILAEHLGNASATSKLSAEMLINDKEAMPKSDNITIFP